jgi:DNA-binding NarL/FixJ family response regulator
MLKIVLADDHHVVRQGLRTLLEATLPCSIVGEAADGRATVELVERTRPTVLVVDMRMPELSGLEVIRRVHSISPQTRIVVLSMYANENHVREALQAGATAYVLKDARADEFVHSIREASAGRRYLSPPLSERAIEAYIHQDSQPSPDAYDTLSSRERDILSLLAQGFTSAQIAERLDIGKRTVESHRASLMHKLALHGQVELLRYALRRGIISLDE